MAEMHNECFEYGIIGAGPAGYTAAIYLAKKGHSVVLFEKERVGGTCLNKGCIPTKSFLHFADMYATLLKNQEIGIDTTNFDFTKIIEKKDKTIEKIRKALELTIKNCGIQTVYAEAHIKDDNTIQAGNDEYCVANIIIATGAKPKQVKNLPFDGKFILSSDDILQITQLPKSVLIVGSGAIGIEWARILADFGVEVSVVEMAEHLIPAADIEISKRVERIFKQKKIKFYLNDHVEQVENKTATLSSGEKIQPDFILVAIGREPVCPSCSAGIRLGDVCGEIQLAHYAISQAKELALGIPFDKDLIPAVIYGEPEIAWVGKKEQDCTEDCKVTTIPLTALGKSWCDEATEGFIKVITQKNQIVGAHIISREASSLIHILLTAIQNALSINDLQKMCFAHPTYAEGIADILINLSI